MKLRLSIREPQMARAQWVGPRSRSAVGTIRFEVGAIGLAVEDAPGCLCQVLDEVRHQSARQLLANTDLAMGEVAFLLGFEEVNSFMRAFHAWEGTTPVKWRARASARGDGLNGRAN